MDKNERIRTIDDHLRSLESWIGDGVTHHNQSQLYDCLYKIYTILRQKIGITTKAANSGNANNAVAFLYTAGRHLESARNITNSEVMESLSQRYELLKGRAVKRFGLVPVKVSLPNGEAREYLELPTAVASEGYSGR